MDAWRVEGVERGERGSIASPVARRHGGASSPSPVLSPFPRQRPVWPAWSSPRATKPPSSPKRLAALANQVDLAGRPLPRSSYEILVMANNCRDDTARVARRLAEGTPPGAARVEIELPTNEAHVGTARRLAMDEACRRLLLVGRPHGLIATTDADTDRGADLARRDAPRGRAWHRGHRWSNPDRRTGAAGDGSAPARPVPAQRRLLRPRRRGRGAGRSAPRRSLAPPRPVLRGQPRRHGGRLPARRRVAVLPSGEDVALGRALRRADVEIRHSPDVRVYTSARLRGRTPAGLAAQLTSWSALADEDDAQRVPSPTTVLARAACRRALRDQWRRARRRRGLPERGGRPWPTTIGVSGRGFTRPSCGRRRSAPCSTRSRPRRPGPARRPRRRARGNRRASRLARAVSPDGAPPPVRAAPRRAAVRAAVAPGGGRPRERRSCCRPSRRSKRSRR